MKLMTVRVLNPFINLYNRNCIYLNDSCVGTETYSMHVTVL